MNGEKLFFHVTFLRPFVLCESATTRQQMGSDKIMHIHVPVCRQRWKKKEFWWKFDEEKKEDNVIDCCNMLCEETPRILCNSGYSPLVTPISARFLVETFTVVQAAILPGLSRVMGNALVHTSLCKRYLK